MNEYFTGQVNTNPKAEGNEFEFDLPLVNIGSHPDNNVSISGKDVLPFHAAFYRQNGNIRIIKTAPDAEIRIEGNPLQTASASVGENQRIDIGSYAIFLRTGPSPSGMHLVLTEQTATNIPPVQSGVDVGEQNILVNLMTQQTEVEVEQTAIYQFEIVNAGRIVAGFYVNVSGVPDEWVQVSPRLINLNEGQRANVRIGITPPRASSSTAGKHPISIVVTSPNYPRQQSVTRTDFTILPYYEFMVGNLSPRQKTVRWRDHKGTVQLPINNQSNTGVDFNVVALDEENGCNFDFVMGEDYRLTRQAVLPVAQSHQLELPIEITPIKQPVISFRSKRYHYTTTINIAGQASAPQTVSGSVVSRPLLGWFSILFTVLMVLIGFFILIQPRINYFQVAASKDVIELGDTTQLEWAVSPFASRLNISNTDKVVTRGMKRLTVAPQQSSTYELVAGNWVSGMLGLDRRAALTVLVVPPSPEITVFAVDKRVVDKGVPVNLRWSVTKAEKVLLTIDEVVYELPKDQFSGQQSVLLEQDSVITLRADSLSGSELRSMFVKVVPPKITVNKFTIWVSTSGGTAAVPNSKSMVVENQSLEAKGSPHKAAVLPVSLNPQPKYEESDFPYKFVELIMDKASETGYRVEFLIPGRELAKGEQVMLEWEVDGVDNVKIAPFTETLPSKGRQPFFPQESMNFVMTAKSGELEQIFMLPVVVFDGVPPTTPKVDFFKAVPTKMVGAGDVQFSWSVSGEWTHIQLAKGVDNGEEVVADWINPQGFKTLKVDKSTTFLLKAWNGSLSTASPVDITVDPSLIPIGIKIKSVYTDADQFILRQKVTVTVEFLKIPADKPAPSGKVIVTDGYSICEINLPALSCDLTFNTPGAKNITASYAGDSIYLQATSAPYPTPPASILVQSTKVDLVPGYFVLQTGADITNISDPAFELAMDQGLRIIVEVRPLTLSVPDDSKSKVNISICEQDATEAIVPGSCLFLASATAEKYTGQTPTFNRVDGLFYANIVIPRFLVPGTRLLLFEYYHDSGEIEPTTFEQPSVHIGRVKFHLSTDICTDPDTLTGCELGTADPANAEIVFSFRTSDPFANIQSILPRPPESAFKFSSKGLLGTVVGEDKWTCSVKIIGGIYKLVCKVLGLDALENPWTVSYEFDDTAGESYYFGSLNTIETRNFQLNVLKNTAVVFEENNNLSVGKIVQLTGTGGLVSLRDAENTPLDGTITITEKEGKSLESFTCSDTTNCSQDSTTGAITINSTSAPSSIYLKKAGSIELVGTYAAGTGGYLPSSGSKLYSVSKLDTITTEAAWWYSNNGANAWPTDLIVNQELKARVRLDIPGVDFNDKVLLGRNVIVTVIGSSAVPNCTIGAPGTGTAGEYMVKVTWNDTSSPPGPKLDFSMNCGSNNATLPYPVELELSFANAGDDLTAGDDFVFSSTATTNKFVNIKVADNLTLTASVVRFPVAGHPEMISNTAPASLSTFHIGEKYSLSFRISSIFGSYNNWGSPYTSNAAIINDYLNNDNSIVITFPDNVAAAIDWSQSTCGAENAIKVRLNQRTILNSADYSDRTWNFWKVRWDYWYWGWVEFELYNNPCYIVFKSTADSPGQNTTFSFTSHNNSYKSTRSYANDGVKKQDLSISVAPSPTSGYVNISLPVTISLTPTTNTDTTLPPIESTVTNFDTQFVVLTDCDGTTINDKKIIDTKTAQFTIKTTAECVDKKIKIRYVQNKYFNAKPAIANTYEEFTYSIQKHNAAASLEYKNGTTWVTTFPFDTNDKQAISGDLYTFRVKVTDNDNPVHTVIPTGKVKVTATGGTFKINGVDVTPTTFGEVDLVNGYAEFTIQFSGNPTVDISLKYEYAGSTVFNPTTAANSPVFKIKP